MAQQDLLLLIGNVGVSVTGEENPSGKLAETWPLRLEDNPSYLNFPGVDGQVDYREGIYIGYRYYDKKDMQVLFPFGHGLSYTKFEYSSLKLDKASIRDTDTLTVSCKVSGLELIEWVNEHSADTEYIILNCHDEFDFARQAVRLKCLVTS